MNILMVGDVVGKAGREAVKEYLPGLREQLALDFVVVNGENAAHGFGITDRICQSLYQAGADVITTGNHVWDQREIMNYIDGDDRLPSREGRGGANARRGRRGGDVCGAG